MRVLSRPSCPLTWVPRVVSCSMSGLSWRRDGWSRKYILLPLSGGGGTARAAAHIAMSPLARPCLSYRPMHGDVPISRQQTLHGVRERRFAMPARRRLRALWASVCYAWTRARVLQRASRDHETETGTGTEADVRSCPSPTGCATLPSWWSASRAWPPRRSKISCSRA